VEHRRWTARVISNDFPLLVLDAEFDRNIEHDLLGTIAAGTLSREFYWLDRWYNVFRFSDYKHQLEKFYCNINMPPSFDGEVLRYVDLDIDVLVQPDFSYQILDLADFEENSKRYRYPTEVRENALLALDQLIQLVEAREFPFDIQ
jgi:uncharacterized protein